MSNEYGLCPFCDGDGVRVFQRTATGGLVPYSDELSRCENCGQEFYTFEQSMASSRAYASAIRVAERFPTPEAIRRTRLGLGMTQEQFERALGVGKKTVVRWERGTVAPSRAAGGMLWLAAKHPSVFLEYARTIDPEISAPDEQVLGTIFTATNQHMPTIAVRHHHKPRSMGAMKVGGGGTIARSTFSDERITV